MLLKIAQVMEDSLEYLATLETIDNGKLIREARAADIPYCVDHFLYFRSVIRADEGSISELDKNTSILVKKKEQKYYQEVKQEIM